MAAMIAALVPTAVASPPTLADAYPRIAAFRRLVLSDSTPLDVCTIADAYDDRGRVRPEFSQAPFATRSQCPVAEPTRTYPRVALRSPSWRGDTLVIHGSTARRGFRVMEGYQFVRLATGAIEHVYSVTGIVEE